MKKKILFLILIFSALVFSFMLSSCSKGTKGLEFIEINDEEYGVKCGEAINENEIVIPKKHDGKPVTVILKSGFSKCEQLTSIKIPSSITKIEMGAFFNCNKLENVYYAGKLKDWCNIEFEHSTSNPMSVAKNFYVKNVLANEIKISGTDKINAYAFFGIECLYKVTIEDDVLFIGDSAFAGCTNLSEVTLPSNIEYLNKLVFSGCETLKEITIPANVRVIHPLAFYGCTLRSVSFENINGWYCVSKEADTKGDTLTVTDSEANAQALSSKSHSLFWKRKLK